MYYLNVTEKILIEYNELTSKNCLLSKVLKFSTFRKYAVGSLKTIQFNNKKIDDQNVS